MIGSCLCNFRSSAVLFRLWSSDSGVSQRNSTLKWTIYEGLSFPQRFLPPGTFSLRVTAFVQPQFKGTYWWQYFCFFFGLLSKLIQHSWSLLDSASHVFSRTTWVKLWSVYIEVTLATAVCSSQSGAGGRKSGSNWFNILLSYSLQKRGYCIISRLTEHFTVNHDRIHGQLRKYIYCRKMKKDILV